MTLRARAAGWLDAREMAEILAEHRQIVPGSAQTEPVLAGDVRGWMARDPDRCAWQVAETSAGTILGLQWIAPAAWLPPEACEIATVVRPGRSAIAAGSVLFAASAAAARGLEYRWIGARIGAGNRGGLAYYQSRGFETLGRRHEPRDERWLLRYEL